MPLYEYECDACGRRFERISEVQRSAGHRLSQRVVAPSGSCFSSPAIQFKGSGFYITDYAKAGASGSEGGQD